MLFAPPLVGPALPQSCASVCKRHQPSPTGLRPRAKKSPFHLCPLPLTMDLSAFRDVPNLTSPLLPPFESPTACSRGGWVAPNGPSCLWAYLCSVCLPHSSQRDHLNHKIRLWSPPCSNPGGYFPPHLRWSPEVLWDLTSHRHPLRSVCSSHAGLCWSLDTGGSCLPEGLCPAAPSARNVLSPVSYAAGSLTELKCLSPATRSVVSSVTPVFFIPVLHCT